MALPVSAEVLRHSLELLDPQLKTFIPPGEPFDPAGAWNQSYFLWAMHTPPRTFAGRLKIQRAALADGVRFEVEQELRMAKQFAPWTRASIECAADRWSTPRRFTVETWVATPDGTVEPDSRGKFSAEVVGPEIHYSGTHKAPVHLSGDWTLDWTLLDAVQRLPFQAGGDWQFDMVEDCDLLRPRQQLSYAGAVTTSLGGKNTELHAFCQTGTGTLPTQYWLDVQHRLLAVIHYYRAFLLESGMPKPAVKRGKGK